MDAALVRRRYSEASEEVRRAVDRLLEQDADDHAWAEQLGPAYRQGDVAELLGKSKQAVSADRRLLRLEMRDGTIGYPVFQFDGRCRLAGIDEVVTALSEAVTTSWTTASWLTSPTPELGGARPLDALRQGRVDEVVLLARRLAARLAG